MFALRRICWVLATTTAASVTAHAAEEAVVLEPVTVTASPFKRDADRLVQPVAVLSGADLDRARRPTLGETLESTPGVASSDFGPGVGRPIIRGQAGARVLLLENGLPTMDAGTVSADHAVALDADNAQQIEIIKGPAALVYGSGATAGVVNVVNHRLPLHTEEGLGGRVAWTLGNNGGENQAQAALDAGRERWHWHVDASQRRAEGDFRIPGNSSTDGDGGQGRILNSAVNAQNGAVGLGWRGDSIEAATAVSVFDTRYGLPNEEAAFIDLHQSRVDGLLRWRQPLAAFERVELRLGATDYRHTEFEEPGEAGTRFTNEQQGLRVEATHVPVGGLRGVLGLQLDHRNLAAIGDEAFLPPTNSRLAGVFLVEEYRLGAVSFEGGVRVDTVRHRAEDGASRDFTPFTGSLGALWAIDRNWHARANYTNSQRAPAAEELFSAGPHLATASFERGDLNLRAERANTLELGLDRHLGRFTLSSAVFYEHIQGLITPMAVDCNRDADDFITACTPDGIADIVSFDGHFGEEEHEEEEHEEEEGHGHGSALALLDYRATNARRYGAELEMRYRLLTGAHKLQVRATGDLVRAEQTDGTPLPRTTPARLGAGLNWVHGSYNVDLGYQWVMAQNRIAPLETRTAGFGLLSTDVSWGMPVGDGQQLKLHLRGRNLTNEEVRRHTSFVKDSYPLPGRSLFAGLEWQF